MSTEEKAQIVPRPSATDNQASESLSLAPNQELMGGEDRGIVDLERPSGDLFRLINIHLIDSLSKGRIQTMGVDGGTALTGRNGQGKTSLLSLALLFIGVEPTYLVSRGKDSFIEYYLPNPTSYIAYEYERPDGQRRVVVAYGNATSDKVFFRFVKHGFMREMFVTEDEQFVLNKDFRRRLSELGVSCADKQVETYQDYRCIIQYWQPLHADNNHRRYLMGMSTDYGFTTYRRSLRHLEKLTRGMFSRQANFDDLRQVVSDWVFEGKPSIGIQTERRKVETWPRDYRAYKEIMRIEPLVKGAQEVLRELEATHKDISEIKEKFLFLQDHLVAAQSAQRVEEARLLTYLTDEHNRHSALATEIQAGITSIEININALQGQLNDIETKRQYYTIQEIDKKRAQAGQLEIFTERLRSTEAQLEVLQGELTHIKSKYDKLINDEQARFLDLQRAGNNKIQLTMEEERLALVALEETLKSDLGDFIEESIPEETHLSGVVSQLHQDVGAAKARVETPGDDPELQKAIELKDAEASEATAKVMGLQTTISDFETEAQNGRVALDKAENNIVATEEAISVQEREIQEIIRAHAPESNTLLHFLRGNHPDWITNIAKVINPQLLQRTDLNPQLTGLAETFYGVGLDLDLVDAVDEADESKLKELLAEAENQLEVLHTNRKAAVDRRNQLLDAMKHRGDELGQLRSQQVGAKSRMQILSSELGQLKNRLFKERHQAKLLSQNALAQVEDDLKQAEQMRQKFQAEVAHKQASIQARGDSKRAAIRNQHDQKRKDIQNSVGLQHIATQRAIGELKENQNKELKGAGADVEVINELDARVKNLKELILEINGWAQLIAEWRYWHDNVENTESALLEEQAALNINLHEKKTDLTKANTGWDRLKREITESINTCQTAIQQINVDLNILTNALAAELETYRPTDRYSEYDQAWQANVLKSSLRDKQMEVRRANKALDQQVGKMDAAFLSTPNSPPSDYFQDRVGILRDESDNEVTSQMKLQVIEEWFSNHHEKSRRLLIADAHTIFGEIQDLHRELKKFTDKITRFNTGLQNHLSHSSKVFDSINDLQVSIFSAVEDLDYWSIISKISKARDEWVRPDELPNDEAVDNLQRLLETWDIKNGIQADFKSLVSIRGSVREKGNLRHFRNKVELENISSNGLSYLILIILFLGFISKVRGNAPVQLTWCVDELKAIDAENVISLCNYLGQNCITLCTAFPDPDAETLILFENKYKLDSERRLVHCELAIDDGLDEGEELELELEDC